MKRAVLAVLGVALVLRGLGRRSLRGVATAAVGGWLLSRAVDTDDRLGRALRSRLGFDGGAERWTGADPVEFRRTVTVGRPADELYDAWRDPDQFARVFGHFAEVTPAGENRFHWTVHGPADPDVSWETHVVEQEPGEFVRWASPGDALVPNEGTVSFRPAPGDRGTNVTLSVRFDAPGGALGTGAIERFDVVPKALVGTALRRFKSLAESGEIPTLAGNPSARGRGDLL